MYVLTRLTAHVCVRVRAGFGVVLRVDFVLRVQAQGSGFRAPVLVERCSLKRPQRCSGKSFVGPGVVVHACRSVVEAHATFSSPLL